MRVNWVETVEHIALLIVRSTVAGPRLVTAEGDSRESMFCG